MEIAMQKKFPRLYELKDKIVIYALFRQENSTFMINRLYGNLNSDPTENFIFYLFPMETCFPCHWPKLDIDWADIDPNFKSPFEDSS